MPDLAELLADLDLSLVAPTGEISADGRISPVGLEGKLAAAWLASQFGRVRYVVTAQGQMWANHEGSRPLVDGEPLGADVLSTITLVTADSFRTAVEKLSRHQGRRALAIAKAREQCPPKMELLHRRVDWEFYHELKMFFRVERKDFVEVRPGRERDPLSAGPPQRVLAWEEQLLRNPSRYSPPYTLSEILSTRFAGLAQQPGAKAPRLVVLASPGGGKSTLCHAVLRRMVNELNWPDLGRPLVPAFVRLRDWHSDPHRRKLSLTKYLAATGGVDEPDWWESQLKNGDVFLLLDGLDEVPHGGEVLRTIESALTTFDNCPTLITCRTIEYETCQGACAGFAVVALGGFTEDADRRSFLESYPGRQFAVPEMEAAIRANPAMHEIATNPLLLAVLCEVANDPRVQLPATRGELLDAAIRRFWQQRGGPRRTKATLDAHEARELLEAIAFDLLVNTNAALVYDADQVFQAIKKRMPRRSPGKIAEELVGNSGLLRGDPVTGYTFLHRLFQQFLAASYMARMMEHASAAKPKDRERAESFWRFVNKKAWDPAWHEVIVLLAGRMKNPNPLLDQLSTPEAEADDSHDRDDMYRHRLAVAAHCLPEIPLAAHRVDGVNDRFGQIASSVLLQNLLSDGDHEGPSRAISSALRPIVLAGALIQLDDESCRDEQAARWRGTPAATVLDWLAHQLSDRSDRWSQVRIGRTLAQIGEQAVAHSGVVDNLLTLLRHGDQWEIETVSWVIRNGGEEAMRSDVVETLLELLQFGTSPQIVACAHVLSGIGRRAAKDPRVIARLTDVVWSGGVGEERAAAAEALGNLGPPEDDRVVKTLRERFDLSEDSDELVAIGGALGALASLTRQPAAVLNSLIGHLAGPPNRAIGALRALQQVPEIVAESQSLTDYLFAQLGSQENGLRIEAVRVFRSLGGLTSRHAEIMDALLSALDEGGETAQAAAWALGTATPVGVARQRVVDKLFDVVCRLPLQRGECLAALQALVEIDAPLAQHKDLVHRFAKFLEDYGYQRLASTGFFSFDRLARLAAHPAIASAILRRIDMDADGSKPWRARRVYMHLLYSAGGLCFLNSDESGHNCQLRSVDELSRCDPPGD